jgi:hypothetical protein
MDLEYAKKISSNKHMFRSVEVSEASGYLQALKGDEFKSLENLLKNSLILFESSKSIEEFYEAWRENFYSKIKNALKRNSNLQ